MAVTWAQVLLVAPELSSITDTSAQALFLDIASRQVDPDVCGEFTDDMHRYMTAHLATLGAGGSAGGAAGPVTSETLGPMSRSYGTLSGASTEDSLGLTRYGLEYKRLANLLAPSIGVVV